MGTPLRWIEGMGSFSVAVVQSLIGRSASALLFCSLELLYDS